MHGEHAVRSAKHPADTNARTPTIPHPPSKKYNIHIHIHVGCLLLLCGPGLPACPDVQHPGHHCGCAVVGPEWCTGSALHLRRAAAGTADAADASGARHPASPGPTQMFLTPTMPPEAPMPRPRRVTWGSTLVWGSACVAEGGGMRGRALGPCYLHQPRRARGARPRGARPSTRLTPNCSCSLPTSPLLLECRWSGAPLRRAMAAASAPLRSWSSR